MKKLALSTALALAAAPAMAHPGHGFGLTAGILHPLTGADHLLAMLAVGLWSGFVLPRRVWAGAAAFLTGMGLGAGLTFAGGGLPMTEPAILASVLAFGALVALARRGQSPALTAATLAAIAAFGAAHGAAHAGETTGPLVPFAVGVLLSTAALHLSGIGLARRLAGGRLAQGLLGAGIAGAGLWLMVG